MTDKAVGVMSHHDLKNMLHSNARSLGYCCGAAAVELLIERLVVFIGSPEDDKYSYIWRSAIEEHDVDDYKEDYRNTLIDGVRDSLLGFVQATPSEAHDVLKKLLWSEYKTLIRIGLFACGEYYNTLRDLFWKEFRSEWFVDFALWHEIFWLIKKAAPTFTATERDLFLNKVLNATLDPEKFNDLQSETEKHQRDLLYPATLHGHKEIDEKYQKLNQIYGAPAENVDLLMGPVRAEWGGERSPVSVDQIIANSAEWLEKQMRSFEPTGEWRAPSLNGFANAITESVRVRDDGFIKSSAIFLGAKPAYQQGFLRGIYERWATDKKEIDWALVLDFISSVILVPSFATQLEQKRIKEWEPSAEWFVSEVGSLLKAGAQDPARIMPLECMPIALKILQWLIEMIPATNASEVNDAVSHAINVPRGRVFEAYINLALAMRRVELSNSSSTSEVWGRIESTFNAELSTSEIGENAEFSAFCGLNCDNFHYLNSDWVETNFDRLFPNNVPVAWRCAVQGLSYQRYLYEWLFVRLRDGGHLERMIFADDLPSSVSNKAVQFIGLAYLEGFEPLNLDSVGLIGRIIRDPDPTKLKSMAWFFWSCRGIFTADEVRKERVLDFWFAIHATIVSSELRSPQVSSSLVLLSAFVDVLTGRVKDALLRDAPYAQVGHHGHILIEELRRLVVSSPLGVYEVIMAALEGFVPEYDLNHVVSIVEGIAAAGLQDESEAICKKFVDKGSTALKETYSKIRTKGQQ